jgi:hypothetical protein
MVLRRGKEQSLRILRIFKVINISSKTKLFTLTGEKYGISSITRRTGQGS